MSEDYVHLELDNVAVLPDHPAEQVLVFDADILPPFPPAHILKDDVQAHLDRILPDAIYYDRDAAETDESVKQLIPYVVLQKGNEVFCYRRTKKGGESRLHDKWSVGVGGHINDGDSSYWEAVWRELYEEVFGLGPDDAVPVADEALETLALLYDDRDAVGRVHFGVVHRLRLPRNMDLKLSEELADGRWVHRLDLKRDDSPFENWSRIVIDEVL